MPTDSGSPDNSFIQLRGFLADFGGKLSAFPEEHRDLRSQLARGLGWGSGNTPDPTRVKRATARLS